MATDKKLYNVYALIKDNKVVYIGCTSNISRRIYDHRRTKNFDKNIIIKSYKNKKDALIAENSIINFLTLFGDGKWYNAENILLACNREFHLKN